MKTLKQTISESLNEAKIPSLEALKSMKATNIDKKIEAWAKNEIKRNNVFSDLGDIIVRRNGRMIYVLASEFKENYGIIHDANRLIDTIEYEFSNYTDGYNIVKKDPANNFVVYKS